MAASLTMLFLCNMKFQPVRSYTYCAEMREWGPVVLKNLSVSSFSKCPFVVEVEAGDAGHDKASVKCDRRKNVCSYNWSCEFMCVYAYACACVLCDLENPLLVSPYTHRHKCVVMTSVQKISSVQVHLGFNLSIMWCVWWRNWEQTRKTEDWGPFPFSSSHHCTLLCYFLEEPQHAKDVIWSHQAY